MDMLVDLKNVGEVFKKYRLLRGKTQEEAGVILQITRVAYSNIERGVTIPNALQIQTLANSLEIPWIELLSGETDLSNIQRLTQEVFENLTKQMDAINQFGKI